MSCLCVSYSYKGRAGGEPHGFVFWGFGVGVGACRKARWLVDRLAFSGELGFRMIGACLFFSQVSFFWWFTFVSETFTSPLRGCTRSMRRLFCCRRYFVKAGKLVGNLLRRWLSTPGVCGSFPGTYSSCYCCFMRARW